MKCLNKSYFCALVRVECIMALYNKGRDCAAVDREHK